MENDNETHTILPNGTLKIEPRPPVTLHVALLLPNSDGSGDTKVLGIFENLVYAEAACYREIRRLGYDQNTGVAELELNKFY